MHDFLAVQYFSARQAIVFVFLSLSLAIDFSQAVLAFTTFHDSTWQ
jgi:hypothetical protein